MPYEDARASEREDRAGESAVSTFILFCRFGGSPGVGGGPDERHGLGPSTGLSFLVRRPEPSLWEAPARVRLPQVERSHSL
jgi:hypothetical protein